MWIKSFYGPSSFIYLTANKFAIVIIQKFNTNTIKDHACKYYTLIVCKTYLLLLDMTFGETVDYDEQNASDNPHRRSLVYIDITTWLSFTSLARRKATLLLAYYENRHHHTARKLTTYDDYQQ